MQPAPPQPVFAGNLVVINPFVALPPSGASQKEQSSPTSNSADNITPKRKLNRKNKGSAPQQEHHRDRDTPSRSHSQPTTTELFYIPNTTTNTAPTASSAFNFNPFPQQPPPYPVTIPSTIAPPSYHPSLVLPTGTTTTVTNPFSQTSFAQPSVSQGAPIIQNPPTNIIQPPQTSFGQTSISQGATIIQNPPTNIIQPSSHMINQVPNISQVPINPFLNMQNNGSSGLNNFSHGFQATTIAPQGLFFNVN